ncbi:MAG: GMP synthase [Ignavibacteriae bacterium]|nr:GMP synthase [Ignavibacteriota bacterium]
MRCIQDILNETDCNFPEIPIDYKIYDSRYKNEVPDDSYDIYISSGGPGSPFEGEGKVWEKDYFNLMDKIWANNKNSSNSKKHLFFICHSFQIMARYFKFGEVIPRNSKSFGVMPVHKTEQGENDPILKGLPDPFFAADFRDWQVVQPNEKVLNELGAKIICLEKERPHVEFERALMGIRISDEIVGTQFHPEADPASMYYHFRKPERKEQVVSKYGEEKYFEMLNLLEKPDSIPLTRKTVLPGFLSNAVKLLRPEKIIVDY